MEARIYRTNRPMMMPERIDFVGEQPHHRDSDPIPGENLFESKMILQALALNEVGV